MSNVTATGRCLCGKISYRITGPKIWSGYCHCESCRRFSGAVVTSWLGISDTDLEFDQHQPAVYQSEGVKRGFCPSCGSSLTYQSERFPDYIQLHLGSLDQPQRYRPQDHVHYAEKVAWFELDDGLPRFDDSAADDNNDWMKPY